MLSGHFLSSPNGKVFVTQHGDFSNKHVILCLPSITEEMNLSRAVIAGQAEYFAEQGITTIIVDYYGTGDSEGEFNEICATDWIADIITAGKWALDQGANKISLWGIRFGSLLAMHYDSILNKELPLAKQLHWKPIINGKLFAGQFLRIKQANNMMNKSASVNWRQLILDDEEVDIAGYPLNRQMLLSLESLSVDDSYQPDQFIDWREIGGSMLAPYTKKITEHWSSEQFKLQSFLCPAFWQIPEIFSLPELYQSHNTFLEGIV